MSKHRQQSWVARQPGGKYAAPMENTSAPPEPLPPPVAFMPSHVDDPPADASYMGDVPDGMQAPPRVLRHDRLRKDGVTYIVVGVTETEVTLMGGKTGTKTIPISGVKDYER